MPERGAGLLVAPHLRTDMKTLITAIVGLSTCLAAHEPPRPNTTALLGNIKETSSPNQLDIAKFLLVCTGCEWVADFKNPSGLDNGYRFPLEGLEESDYGWSETYGPSTFDDTYFAGCWLVDSDAGSCRISDCAPSGKCEVDGEVYLNGVNMDGDTSQAEEISRLSILVVYSCGGSSTTTLNGNEHDLGTTHGMVSEYDFGDLGITVTCGCTVTLSCRVEIYDQDLEVWSEPTTPVSFQYVFSCTDCEEAGG